VVYGVGVWTTKGILDYGFRREKPDGNAGFEIGKMMGYPLQ
jgi:hypothetical protein